MQNGQKWPILLGLCPKSYILLLRPYYARNSAGRMCKGLTLTNMDTRTRHNNIRFNASKCKALTITRKKSPLDFIYKLDNVELERVSTEKDIGANITNSLTWNTHIHANTAKANKLLGLLKRTCPLLTRHSKSNSIELNFNRTQSNSIRGLSSIEFGNPTKSNSPKRKKKSIEPNRTFDFRTRDLCKTGFENP